MLKYHKTLTPYLGCYMFRRVGRINGDDDDMGHAEGERSGRGVARRLARCPPRDRRRDPAQEMVRRRRRAVREGSGLRAHFLLLRDRAATDGGSPAVDDPRV